MKRRGSDALWPNMAVTGAPPNLLQTSSEGLQIGCSMVL